MTPERWQQVKAVVGRALETPPAEREALLAAACGADLELRQEVVSLLASAEGADSLPGARAAVAGTVRALRAARLAEDRALDAARPPADDPDRALRPVLEAALGAQYDILAPLGRGGMGAVYLARERALERFVAIKVLRPDLAAAPESRERFRREARIAAQLAHPGILPLHTFGEVDGVWYFVMGYVRGESLADRLRREGALPHDEARRILTELADALAVAHRHGVVHRDIKPANVLLDEEFGRATLADFGISKLLDADDGLTASGAVMGTPHYMSPEQALGAADLDARSDVYSLGAVAYTMLAGREPFAGETVADLVYQRLSTEPPPLRTLVPTVPAAVEAVVMRCLARDPALRWPDARALHEALLHADAEPASLPEAVRDLPGFGPYALVWALGWCALAFNADPDSIDRALLLLIAVLVPVGLALHVWNTGRQGLPALQVARVACWPPPWWGMWWPRALRRPGDLWPRLPRPARAVRLVLSTFFIALPALILVRQAVDGPDLRRAAGAVQGGLLAASLVGLAAAYAWARHRGLSLDESVRLLLGATLPSPAWRAPRLVALLRPTMAGVRRPDPDSGADHLRAVDELAALLPEPAALAGAQAVRAAQRLAYELAATDREIATLARDASSTEVDRVAARLAALEATDAPDTAERRELRALVQQQLVLVRRMHGRHEVACRERAHLLDLLRGVWVQLCAVHDATAGDARAAAVARLRTIGAEVEAMPERTPRAGVSGGDARYGASTPTRATPA